MLGMKPDCTEAGWHKGFALQAKRVELEQGSDWMGET